MGWRESSTPEHVEAMQLTGNIAITGFGLWQGILLFETSFVNFVYPLKTTIFTNPITIEVTISIHAVSGFCI